MLPAGKADCVRVCGRSRPSSIPFSHRLDRHAPAERAARRRPAWRDYVAAREAAARAWGGELLLLLLAMPSAAGRLPPS